MIRLLNQVILHLDESSSCKNEIQILKQWKDLANSFMDGETLLHRTLLTRWSIISGYILNLFSRILFSC